jgi:hypothetical protein
MMNPKLTMYRSILRSISGGVSTNTSISTTIPASTFAATNITGPRVRIVSLNNRLLSCTTHSAIRFIRLYWRFDGRSLQHIASNPRPFKFVRKRVWLYSPFLAATLSYGFFCFVCKLAFGTVLSHNIESSECGTENSSSTSGAHFPQQNTPKQSRLSPRAIYRHRCASTGCDSAIPVYRPGGYPPADSAPPRWPPAPSTHAPHPGTDPLRSPCSAPRICC